MKIGRLLFGALFLVGSLSASAAMYSVHKVKTVNVKIASLQDGKIETENVKTKDVAEDLNNGEKLGKKEKLVAIMPCPITDPVGDFYLVIWDTETGMRKDGTFGIPVVITGGTDPELKDGNISKVVVMADFDTDMASLTIDAKEVNDKNNESGLDGMNCVKKGKSSAVNGVDGNEVTKSGKYNIDKIIDGATTTETKMPIPPLPGTETP